MIDALNAAASSMAADVSRLNTISQNLANATTPGYKREVAVGVPFQQLLGDVASIDAAGATASAVDHRHGTLRQTGGALDVAIDGEGFFEVSTDHGPAYTRRGDFRLDASGRLVTQTGHAVQGVSGALYVQASQPKIDRDGRIFDGDKLLGQLKIVAFSDARRLVRGEGGVFFAAEAPVVQSEGMTRLRQGQLEASNVTTAAEMVKLIETVRHFEATQKLVQGIDDMTERALRKLGEF